MYIHRKVINLLNKLPNRSDENTTNIQNKNIEVMNNHEQENNQLNECQHNQEQIEDEDTSAAVSDSLTKLLESPCLPDDFNCPVPSIVNTGSVLTTDLSSEKENISTGDSCDVESEYQNEKVDEQSVSDDIQNEFDVKDHTFSKFKLFIL